MATTQSLVTNILYFGDNLDILREHVADESVDLVYLDPPFNSKADYNVLFSTPKGVESSAQITAFEDTWHWSDESSRALAGLIQKHGELAELLDLLVRRLGHNDLSAYLVMMGVRLIELHRALKSTGALYLHCDPTASHYLKLLLDCIFGPTNFRSEVIWKRTSAHSSATRYGPIHDSIFFYSKSDSYVWNKQYEPYTSEYIEIFFDQEDPDGRKWKRMDLTGAGIRHGETGKVWRGIDVTAKGRHWAYPPSHLNELDEKKRIHWPKKEGGVPRLKQYIEDLPGIPLQDIWTDIRPLHNLTDERLGYPTQKPISLLERIVKASSNEGDVVLDPFCGCGTAVHAAQKLKREWIGIDITHLAITLIEKRLRDAFPEIKFEVHGTPKDFEGARNLAERDKYQFQWWACSLVNAQPYQGKKKGADTGIDGQIFITDAEKGEDVVKKVLVSVKGGDNVSAQMIRDLAGTMAANKAEIGLFVTLAAPTRPMVTEAAKAGVYYSEAMAREYPRIQILTIEDLLSGKARPEYPDLSRGRGTFKKAETEKKTSKQEKLL